MMMKVAGLVGGFGIAIAALTASSASRADPPLAGTPLVTSSHGQAFCTDKGQLIALLQAQIAHAPFPWGTFNTCSLVPDNALTVVGEDLGPRTRQMHVVRARASLLLGPVEGYTWSVGLSPRY